VGVDFRELIGRGLVLLSILALCWWLMRRRWRGAATDAPARAAAGSPDVKGDGDASERPQEDEDEDEDEDDSEVRVVVPGEAARAYELRRRKMRRQGSTSAPPRPAAARPRPRPSIGTNTSGTNTSGTNTSPGAERRDAPATISGFALPRQNDELADLLGKARTARDPMSLFEAADRLGKQGLVAFCDGLVAQAPLDITLHYRVGRALEERKMIPQALSAYRRVVAFDPSFRDVAERIRALEARVSAGSP
jgi:hypothetical protein